MERIGYIYKITSPTGKIYIGKTMRPNDRISNYRNNCNIDRQRILYNSIQKHGWGNHIFEIIDSAPESELSLLEINTIQKFNSFHGNNPNGMNLTLGGDGATGRKDTRESIRKRVEKIIGRKHREESKRLMSIAKKGKPAHNKGIPCSESAKRKISLANSNREKTEHEKLLMRETRVKRLIDEHGAILQIEPKTNSVLKEWTILPKEISTELGIYSIWKSLKTPNKKAGGYLWSYKK